MSEEVCVDDCRRTLCQIRKALSEIVISHGEDAGVILKSWESPTHYDSLARACVYDHEHISELGGALVALARLVDSALEMCDTGVANVSAEQCELMGYAGLDLLAGHDAEDRG